MSEPINRSRFFVKVEWSHIASSIDSPTNHRNIKSDTLLGREIVVVDR